MCPREQFCNEKGATYFAHPILHCRLSLVKEQTNGARLSTTDGCKIQDADYRICCETTMDTTHTLIQKTNMFSVYVVRIQKCFGHTVSQFCATPELPSKWQYLNQLKSLPNFIPSLSRFQIRKSWLFLGGHFSQKQAQAEVVKKNPGFSYFGDPRSEQKTELTLFTSGLSGF